MRTLAVRLALVVVAAVPFVVAIGQQTSPPPTAEQVFTDIEVFKGVPASDLIPAMQFMSASMNYKCTGCHVENDYAADHKEKDTTRKMIVMQREINEKNFNGRLEVTCMTCHNKKGHPEGMPLPEGVHRRHEQVSPPPKPADLIAKHTAKSAAMPVAIVRKGTLSAPNEQTHKMETTECEFVQAEGGKFRMTAGSRKFGSDGKETWYGLYPLADEPAAIFGRIGRTWVGEADFKGLTRMQVTGKEKVGAVDTIVVQASRASTNSAEELYFDAKTGLLVRMVNYRRSTLGTVASVIDYSGYKKVGGAMMPSKIVATFAEGEGWTMEFKTMKAESTVDEKIFKFGE